MKQDTQEELDEQEARTKENEAKQEAEKEAAEEQKREQEAAEKKSKEDLKSAKARAKLGMPKELMASDQIHSTLGNLRQLTEDRIAIVQNALNMQMFKGIDARLKDRLKELREGSQAFNIRIGKEWTTIPPSMHIRNLEGYKPNRDEAIITYEVYDSDEEHNKVAYRNTATKETPEGKTLEFTASIHYHIRYKVTETLKKNQPDKRKVVEMDLSNKGTVKETQK